MDAGAVEVLFDSTVHPCCFAVGGGAGCSTRALAWASHRLSRLIEPSTLQGFPAWLSSRCSLHTALTLAVAERSVSGGVEQLELSPDAKEQAVDRKRQTAWG